MAKILATGILWEPHLSAFDTLAQGRMAALEIENALVYLIDTVPADVLPYLAEQFDVLGYKGWGLIDVSPVVQYSVHSGSTGAGIAATLVDGNEATGSIDIRARISLDAEAHSIILSKGASSAWAGKWVFGIDADSFLYFKWEDAEGNNVDRISTVAVNALEPITLRVAMNIVEGAVTVSFYFLASNNTWKLLSEDTVIGWDSSIDIDAALVAASFGGRIYSAQVFEGVYLKQNYDPSQSGGSDSWPASPTGETWELQGDGYVSADGFTPEQVTSARRELLKKALELHRYKGTPYAVKEAIKSVGFRDARVIEKVGLKYDGSAAYDGSQTYGSGLPFNFRVVFDLGSQQGITAERLVALTALIDEYKNVRSRLVNVAFEATLEERMFATDDIELTVEIVGIEESALREVRYDGANKYVGSIQYDSTADSVGTSIL